MSAPAIVTVTREIAAPPERVFDAWLDPADARQFLFATEGGEIVRCDIDARVGGRFLISKGASFRANSLGLKSLMSLTFSRYQERTRS